MSGYNTSYLKMILPQVLEEFNPDFICGIIIMLGTNDSAAHDNLHIPLDQFKENLGHIIDHVLKFSKLTNEKIIVISPGLFSI
jgi:lysophospholipase L1-like esterase